MKLAKTMLIYARLSKKFFHHEVKYAHYVYDVIPVKDLADKYVLLNTPGQLKNVKPNVRH